MKKILSSILILIALFVSACGAANPPDAASPTEADPMDANPAPDYPAPDELLLNGYPAAEDYPAPEALAVEGQAGSGSETPLPLDSAPWTALPPVPADADLARGAFFIDRFELQQVDDRVTLYVEGSLPTPCNAPRAYVSQPDAESQIIVELYSVVDPGKVCAQVIEPFAGPVAIFSGMATGTYKVILNGQPAGEFTLK